MSIKLIRLTTGEEIICELGVAGSEYKLKNPVILIPDGGKNLMMLPFMPYAKMEDETLMIAEKSIMFVLDAHDELEKEYKALQSGVERIIEPSKTIVTPSDIAGSIGPQGR